MGQLHFIISCCNGLEVFRVHLTHMRWLGLWPVYPILEFPSKIAYQVLSLTGLGHICDSVHPVHGSDVLFDLKDYIIFNPYHFGLLDVNWLRSPAPLVVLFCLIYRAAMQWDQFLRW